MSSSLKSSVLICLATSLLPVANRLPAADQTSAGERAFFENKIRPILAKHCYKCHSAVSKDLGGKLLLDTRGGMLKGGESGPALVPGRPDESLLVQSLRYDGHEMPPKAQLPEATINDFIKWVKMGAPAPRRTIAATKPSAKSPATANNESLWSFQPVRNPALPKANDKTWPRDSIDQFVLARIEQAQLSPAADAEPAVLIRRLFYDLIGLPPTGEELTRWSSRFSVLGESGNTLKRELQHDAIAELVDTLLASPRFGERWGRHWLDVARYAESNGNDGLSRNPTFPHAWRYRDYVIQSFNDDVPYDRFITEQIAGDLLPAKSDEEKDRLLIATGFLALGAKPAKAMNVNFEMDIVADQIDVIGSGIMGLSVACARCHDHKHDPIPTRDYYALGGIFTSSETMWGRAGLVGLTAPQTPLHVLKTASRKAPPPEAAALFKAAWAKTPNRNPDKPAHKYAPDDALAMGVRECKKPADCKINIGGESKKLGAAVPRGFLSSCQTAEANISINPKESGRLQLAQWLTRREHPQTARVMVNRIWLHLFGQAIVGTPDDFGVYGDRPSHPDLLDHLATRFTDNGWSVKRIIRDIVLSRTYQLGNHTDSITRHADPDNRLYTRHQRRRLDAESLRDSILAASGQLNLQPADGSLVRHLDVLVNQAGNLHHPSNHRSIYLCMLRNSPPPELSAFDLPDAVGVKGKRNVTTLPTQALFLINSPFVVRQASRFAARLLAKSVLDDADRIREGYHCALKREPSTAELKRAIDLVKSVENDLRASVSDPEVRHTKTWSAFCQALLASNEFRYIE